MHLQLSTQPHTQLSQTWMKRLPTLSLTIHVHGCFADKPVRWQASQIRLWADIVRSTHFCIIIITATLQDCNSLNNCIHLASCQQNVSSVNHLDTWLDKWQITWQITFTHLDKCLVSKLTYRRNIQLPLSVHSVQMKCNITSTLSHQVNL